ncbi:alpha/beta hydrolase [Bauldia sp.]|uniref:alpha/beta hydrolase n=1 Tax=Bauldia sp. TaxID=2575872 RepID=UPI003BAAEAED
MLNLVARPVGKFLANTMLKPLPQPFPKTPTDYGLSYRDVAFSTRDGLTLRGWLINEEAAAIVIMTHFGYRANRFGYQLKYQPRLTKPYDKEIEFCNVAKRLVEAGYGVLMYDLRNHGESDKTELGVGTGGKGERFDVIGAVDFVTNEPMTTGKPIGLLSYCYGANTTFFAFEEEADFLVKSGVKALVALQPLSNGDYLKAMKLPSAVFDAAQRHYEANSGGYPFFAPIEAATKFVSVPTRLVQARKDPFTNFDKIEQMYDGIPAEKEMFWLEEPTHRFDGYNWFGDHPRDMLDWFDRHVH